MLSRRGPCDHLQGKQEGYLKSSREVRHTQAPVRENSISAREAGGWAHRRAEDGSPRWPPDPPTTNRSSAGHSKAGPAGGEDKVEPAGLITRAHQGLRQAPGRDDQARRGVCPIDGKAIWLPGDRADHQVCAGFSQRKAWSSGRPPPEPPGAGVAASGSAMVECL